MRVSHKTQYIYVADICTTYCLYMLVVNHSRNWSNKFIIDRSSKFFKRNKINAYMMMVQHCAQHADFRTNRLAQTAYISNLQNEEKSEELQNTKFLHMLLYISMNLRIAVFIKYPYMYIDLLPCSQTHCLHGKSRKNGNPDQECKSKILILSCDIPNFFPIATARIKCRRDSISV